MSYKPYQVVKDFEEAVADFAGAKYGIAMDSCSNALFLCCHYLRVGTVYLPPRTYFSVPCSVIHAGGKVKFTNNLSWSGFYQLKPYYIFDSALRFRKGMYIKGSYYCLSFHAKKHLNIGRGGMILCDDKQAMEYFRKARFDGRSEVPMDKDNITMLGWNMYMTPEQAARGLHLLDLISSHPPLPDIKNNYPDLRRFEDVYSSGGEVLAGDRSCEDEGCSAQCCSA
jgi:hypothetical protein